MAKDYIAIGPGLNAERQASQSRFDQSNAYVGHHFDDRMNANGGLIYLQLIFVFYGNDNETIRSSPRHRFPL